MQSGGRGAAAVARHRAWRLPILALSVVLAMALLTDGLPRAAAETPEERALAEAKADLAQVRDRIEVAERDADDATDALDDADATLREMEAVVNDTTEAVERQRGVTRQAQTRLDRIERDRDELLQAFQQRAIRAYKLGPTTSFDVLLGGDEVVDAVARSTYLQRVLEGDQVDLEAIAAAEVAVEAERGRAQAEEDRLADLLREREEILDEVEELRNMRALEAADAQERVRELRERKDDLEGEQERIEQLIREKEAEERRRAAAARRQAQQQQAPSAPNPPRTTSSAGYSWPMCAPVTSEYGPRWGRMHRGIDLGARTGTPIGAVRAGQVISVGWQGGYGRLVMIRHDDGIVTAYAHMSSFSVSQGQQVQRGQRIGAVGSTGNSTGPHLHLEFRVGGQAQNPRQFLSGSPC